MRYNILVGFILFKNKQFVWNQQEKSGKPSIFCVTNTVEVSRGLLYFISFAWSIQRKSKPVDPGRFWYR